jgi:hypothetical protein
MSLKTKITKNLGIKPNTKTLRMGLSIAFGTAIGSLYHGQALSYNLDNNVLGQQGVFRTQGGK